MIEAEASFDRRVSEPLMRALADRSGLGVLLDIRDTDPTRYDILLAGTGGTESRASLYVGLTKIIDVRERHGLFWLTAHPTYSSIPSFDPRWRQRQDRHSFQAASAAIREYLQAAVEVVAERHLSTEGAVQGLVCSGVIPRLAVVSREAGPSFSSQPTKDRWTEEVGQPLIAGVAATGRTEAWWPGIRDRGVFPSFGHEADVLAVNEEGDLLVVEVKPANAAKGLVWAPAQVRFYAELFARLLSIDAGAVAKLNGMLAQRRSLGLTPSNGFELRDDPMVVPVVAIGAGRVSREVIRRIPLLAASLPEPTGDSRVTIGRVWKLDSTGDLVWQSRATDRMMEMP